tara:strand:+ start:1058 stop:1750 length:693 start_codon:yes stop_codon:yes gene_type:complete
MKNVIKNIAILASIIITPNSFGQAVFQGYDFAVTNPAGVLAAMDKFMASPTGQAFTGSVGLYQYIANGESEATHNIITVHNSREELDQAFARNALSSDWAALLQEMSEAGTLVNTNIGEILLSGGSADNITSANRAGMYYFMSVSNPGAYAQAFSSFIQQNSSVGQSFLSSSIADGENPTTHIVVNWANSVGELLANQPQSLDGWDTYASSVNDMRTVEGTAMVQMLKSW